ncbi:CoA transferase [Dehalococcoidia bacterium]|nr:CoA transferase [Dehalococcoidia bacterium]
MSFAIENVRITDCTWMLAGAGGPRFMASLGAEDIRVEWRENLDFMRTGSPTVIPIGDERDRVLRGEAVARPTRWSINQGGSFSENNPGKRGISLNLRTQKGKEIFKELVSISDIVIESFTSRTMERLGLGYEELRKVNPTVIYIQSSGFGKKGNYAGFSSTGPTAQAISGLTEMAGLPSPYPPAGWGYSYLDWSGAYFNAGLMLYALYYRTRTGKGQYIDAAQAEVGISLTGTAVLDNSANGRIWDRVGNRSPYIPAAPHGAYRCQGDDRWIAISIFNDEEWERLLEVLGDPDWAMESRFNELDSRIQCQDDLDRLLANDTARWDAFQLMYRLQEVGVAAGVCQDAEDRVENDPQLKHLGFHVKLPQTNVGTWPVKDFPGHLSETPAHSGGVLDRGFPNYGEDNDYVYGTLLGIDQKDISQLAAEDVI